MATFTRRAPSYKKRRWFAPSKPAAGVATPADCSFLFQPNALLTHPRTLDTNQITNDNFAGFTGGAATPTQLAFWSQPPFLGPVPKSTPNTNQAFDISPAEPKTPTALAFWMEPPDLQRHVPTIFTAQMFIVNPTIGPPVPGWYTQAPDLLHHPCTLDTNQPFDSAFAGWATNLTPDLLGFFTQAPDLLKHPATLDTRQAFEFAPPPTAATPADCAFLFQPNALLNHAQTLDTNQPLDSAFAGWAQNQTPTPLGFWTQAPDLLKHPATVDTNQAFVFNPPAVAVTPADCAFLFQPNALLRHPVTIDTNQPLADAVAGWTLPTLGFFVQAPDLLRHAVTLDTNQPFNAGFAGQANVTPAGFGFWTQAPDLLRHAATIDTNQAFVFNPPPGALTPADCSFIFQPNALLNHAQTLDTNQDRSFIFDTPVQVAASSLGDADYLLLSELLAQKARGRQLSAKEQRKRWNEVNEAISRFEDRERIARQSYQEAVPEDEEPEIPVPLPVYTPREKKLDIKAAASRMQAHQERIRWLEKEIARVQREIEDEEDDEEALWLLMTS